MQPHKVAWKYAGCHDAILEALMNDHFILCDCWNIEGRVTRAWVVDYIKNPDNQNGHYVTADRSLFLHAKPCTNAGVGA